jgi:hypothetical protein
MDENARARALEERAARSRDLRKLSCGRGYRREDWSDPLIEPGELTEDEVGLLHSQVPGHRWNGWCRLTGDEDYYAVCPCGWCSTDTREISAMLRQVKDHLDGVRAVRGRDPAARAAQATRWDAHERDAGQRRARQERMRELYAAVESQQRRLSQALGQSTDLLSASEEHADRLVIALEHAAAGVAPEWAKTEAPVRRAETLQHWAGRGREVRNGIVAAAAALAVMTEEIAGIHLGLETGQEEAIDWIYGERLIQPAEADPLSGKAAEK